jgi:hypothetical protein
MSETGGACREPVFLCEFAPGGPRPPQRLSHDRVALVAKVVELLDHETGRAWTRTACCGPSGRPGVRVEDGEKVTNAGDGAASASRRLPLENQSVGLGLSELYLVMA